MSDKQKQRYLSWTYLKQLLREKFAVNRAVGYMLLTRGWQFFSAPITIFLIYKCFDERLQGYYYLFISLLATQVFFELGFNSILTLLASHEWSKLRLSEEGDVEGDPSSLSKLSSLVKFGNRWYRWMTLLFIPGLIVGGRFLIHDEQDADQVWLGAWVAACIVNGVSFAYQPRLAILEGCNQVTTVNFVRMFQAMTGTLVVWICIVNGYGLWTIAASNAVRLMWEFYLVNARYRRLFLSLAASPQQDQFSWKEEIWPLQWRLAIQSIGGYFSNYFFIPVIDHYHGKEAAGRFGMTWSIISTLQAASLSWVQTRMPEFGMLTAARRIKELKERMLRIGAISIAVFVTASALFVSAVWTLNWLELNAANRFIAPGSIAVLLIGMLAFQISWVEHSYIRLFKKDPFLIQNLISAAATGVSAWCFGRFFGATGIVVSYFVVCIAFTLPVSTWVLLKHNRSLTSSTTEEK